MKSMVTEKLDYKIVGPMITDKGGKKLIVVKSEPTPAGSLRLMDMSTGKLLDYFFSTVPELLSCNDLIIFCRRLTVIWRRLSTLKCVTTAYNCY